MKLKKIIKLLIDPDYRFLFLASRGKQTHLSSENFLKKMYMIKIGTELNLESPKLYTEKLQWLKLYDHREIYTEMVDKYSVKKLVSERIGEEYVIPLLGVWNNVNDINFDYLPERFVLKTTHDSGTIVICTDKNNFDIKAAKKKLRNALKKNYYECNKEWPYKHVKPKIIAEKYMVDSQYNELRDYKFFTFGGIPRVLYIAQGRGQNNPTVADFFDMEFNHLPFTIDHDMADNLPEKPRCFDEMKRLAEILSQGTPQLRVDFYEVDGKVYFGEMTFFHCSGLEKFHPEKWNRIFGDWVTLPEKSVKN